MNTTILANHLADRFTRHLRREVGTQKMREIAKRNLAENDPNICHSHDFCDANQIMINAWKELWPDVAMDNIDLITEAWDIARKTWEPS